MVKVGWMVDPGLPRAGMVLSVEAFETAKPADVELYHCRPDRRPPDDLDAYILHGDLFDRRWIEPIADKPFMNHRHGMWEAGDPIFRRWVLENADLVTFNSPFQRQRFPYQIDVPIDFVPLPIDIEHFKPRDAGERTGTIHTGVIAPVKGIAHVVDWALRTHTPVDFYGARLTNIPIVPPCRYMGNAAYEAMPGLLAQYKDFVCMHHHKDLYSRNVIEAWAAGCNLILGAGKEMFWDWFDPDACQNAAQTFWDKFRSVMDG